MSIFEHGYPYTDAHELNLDWVIEKMGKINVDEVAAITDTVNQHTQDISDLNDDISDINTEINGVKGRLNVVEGQIDTLTTTTIPTMSDDILDLHTDKLDIGGPAADVSYDNSESQLGATTVQAAIDALVEAGGGGGGQASSVLYNNTESGLTATNVQAAIDELAGKKLKTVTGTLTAGDTTISLVDESITTDSIIDIFADQFGVAPLSAVTIEGSITLVFTALESDLSVKVVILNGLL